MKKALLALLIPLNAALSQSMAVAPTEGTPLHPFEAVYKVSWSGIKVAEMRRSLKPAGNGEYIYRSETKAIPPASLVYSLYVLEESRWRADNRQIKPLHYHYERIKKGEKERKETVFDWPDGHAYSTHNGSKTKHALRAGISDKLLYQLQIVRGLENGLPPSSHAVIDGDAIKTYHFEDLGEEMIKTAMGALSAAKFVQSRAGKKGGSTFWCAKTLRHLPVRIETTDKDGNVTNMELIELTWLADAAVPE